MSQAWLQVVGLVVEFFGVLLLAWEWFAAQRQEATERAIDAEQARRDDGRALMQRHQQANPQMQRHFESVRDIEGRMTAARIDATRRRYGGLRTRAVALALLFVAAGFALQLLGSWPGCCAALGIR
jgi:ferric-dicitrate binding protein FerR (iron transport regulator)